MDVPPVPLMILDALADDFESLESLRGHGEVAPYGLAMVDESEIADALRALLEDGLIAAWEPSGEPVALVPVQTPDSGDSSLRSYWFKWTAEGERAWREAGHVLDAYWTAHPPGG
jgi:hypothetical protein